MYSSEPSGWRGRALLAFLLAGLVSLTVSNPATAVPTVDGARDMAYGSALAVQTVDTGFGDNLSELDAAYGVIDSGKLYLMLTGNIEANFNRLEIFIDSKAGGQSTYASAGNDGTSNLNGLVFDAGFTADYHLIARRGSGSGNDTFDCRGRRPGQPGRRRDRRLQRQGRHRHDALRRRPVLHGRAGAFDALAGRDRAGRPRGLRQATQAGRPSPSQPRGPAPRLSCQNARTSTDDSRTR
jgi:hypothetical protein